MRRRLWYVFAAVGFATFFALWLWSQSANDSALTRVVAPGNAKSVAPHVTSGAWGRAETKADAESKVAITGSNGRAATTYRPGQARAISERVRSSAENAAPLGGGELWLYARSEAEAKWMDRYGYPSPAEDLKLRSSTEAELKALADSGDRNAGAHLMARQLSSVFEKFDRGQLARLTSEATPQLSDGAPYGATIFAQAYGKLIGDYAALPPDQRTENQRDVLLQLKANYAYARVLVSLYGDDTTRPLIDQIATLAEVDHIARQAVSAELPTYDLVTILAASARRREQAGTQMVISPRPKAPEGNRPILLERR